MADTYGIQLMATWMYLGSRSSSRDQGHCSSPPLPVPQRTKAAAAAAAECTPACPVHSRGPGFHTCSPPLTLRQIRCLPLRPPTWRDPRLRLRLRLLPALLCTDSSASGWGPGRPRAGGWRLLRTGPTGRSLGDTWRWWEPGPAAWQLGWRGPPRLLSGLACMPPWLPIAAEWRGKCWPGSRWVADHRGGPEPPGVVPAQGRPESVPEQNMAAAPTGPPALGPWSCNLKKGGDEDIPEWELRWSEVSAFQHFGQHDSQLTIFADSRFIQLTVYTKGIMFYSTIFWTCNM